MITVNKLGIVLEKTTNCFECEGVLNPAVIQVDDTIHLFYRAVAKDNYSTIGHCTLSSPLVIKNRNAAPLLVPQSEYEFQGLEDPRIVHIDEIFYLTYTAYDGINALGALATSSDLINWKKKGVLVPQITYEEFSHFVDTDGMVREKYNRFNEFRASHEKQDRKIFLWDKNLIFFPRKINNNFYFLHRIKPDIQIVVAIDKLEDLTIDFWQN
jgi:predicted GH43/DUF377 family glycosyl hydrolase